MTDNIAVGLITILVSFRHNIKSISKLGGDFMSKRMNTIYVVRTGLLLALALIFQLGLKTPTLIGPLVNFVLIASALTVGTLSGAIIGCFTPLIAILVGVINPFLAPQIPFIIIGNVALVVLFGFVKKRFKKFGEYIGLAVASLVKLGILAGGIRLIVNFYSHNIPANVIPKIIVTFTIPQLYNAIIGGILAVIIVKLLPKSIILKNDQIKG